MALSADSNPPAEQPPSAALSAADLPALESRLKELRDLLASIDGLRAHLTHIIEKAQRDADAAPDLTERQRYEKLYAEAGARLRDLETTRAEIALRLDELEPRIEALRHAR